MKVHYGFFEECGDYENSFSVCEETICGYTGEKVLEEYTVEEWEDVTCKKCLRLKDAVIAGQKLDEEFIIRQMGDMADFFEKEGKL